MSEKSDILRSFLDPKFPYLEEFRKMAPGTHKHCVNTASFCESIALDLKIDEVVLKVAAMYHDIGKINNPDIFSENQNGKKSIHDDLDPLISYELITRHVGDSILYLLQIENMPRGVLDIISQHHGNTVLKFFYKKSDTKIDDLFRYKCSPPQSVEAAILMICDSVEATARALANNGSLDTTSDRKKVVDATIQRLMDDDQLDNMKVGELKIVKRVLCRELENTYHKREIYGDEKTVKEAKGDILVEDIG